MSVALMKNAAYIVHGITEKDYREAACLTKGCTNTALVPPWYVPYGDYCDECRIELKDKESMEVYAEDDLTIWDDVEGDDE